MIRSTSDLNNPFILFIISILFLLYQSTLACGEGLNHNHNHHHRHRRHQPAASYPKSRPTRQLEWGDLNIIHTTDSHGWLMGHLKSEEPEPSYSADFGDFQSFVLSMKEKAKQRKVDLLVVDTGDLHDGNGLSDAEPIIHPGTPRGRSCNQFFKQVPYDILAIGNHELYQLEIAQDMHDSAPSWNGSYLTSNVNITTSGISVPVGSRYRKFTTANGRKITAFGIIFHFKSNANGTIVQPPTELVKEAWFQEAIRDRPDVFLLTGHMGISDPDWKVVFDSIRKLHPKVPIAILGGHLHIRDCRQLDSRSMSLASGRYMETVGWMSLSGLDDPEREVSFSRRYLDNNRETYAFHAGRRFDTPEGIRMTRDIIDKAIEFNLTHRFGVAPHSYFVNRVPQTAANSIYNLLVKPEGVLRTVIKNPERSNPPYFVTNTGASRFDIFSGNFTVNDQYITMPFVNNFLYVADVPKKTADQFLFAINDGEVALIKSRKFSENFLKGIVDKDEDYHSGEDVERFYKNWLKFQKEVYEDEKKEFDQFKFMARKVERNSQVHLSLNEGGSSINYDDNENNHGTDEKGGEGGDEEGNREKSYGYVTKDQCPGRGDDTLHEPFPIYDPDHYLATDLPENSSKVDIVFYGFVEKVVLVALNKIEYRREKKYSNEDVKDYSQIRSNEMIGIYANLKWNH